MRKLVLGAALWLFPLTAFANGSYTHVHMSQLAADELPPGALRDLLAVPENRSALEAGSMFPDSGYAIDDPYGELTHWEPFLGRFIEQLRTTYDGDYSSAEAQRAVAFLLGVASHGMADQSYDTTLLDRAYEVDGPEDSERPVDQYADYFLVIDHDLVYSVEPWGPYDQLVPAIAAAGHELTESTLNSGMMRMAGVIDLQGNVRIAGNLYWDAWESYPFLGTHIYNVEAVGSVPWVANLVQRYWEVLMSRLEASDDVDRQLVIQTMPADGGVNWPIDLEASEAWDRPAIWFGYGIDRDQITPLIELREAESGAVVDVSLETAYGGRERNLVFLRADAPLGYDTEYTVEIAPGVETLDGRTTTEPQLFSFRTRCAPDRLMDCPELDPPLVTGDVPMRPERPDAGPMPDAGPTEAVDAGTPEVMGGGCAASAPRGAAWWLALLGLALVRRRRA